MLKQWLKRKAVVIESSDEEYEPVVANTPVTQPAPKDQTRLQELQPHTAMKAAAAAATDSHPSSPVAESRIVPYCTNTDTNISIPIQLYEPLKGSPRVSGI